MNTIVTLALASDLRSTYIARAVVTGENALAHPHVKDRTAEGIASKAAQRLNSERLVPVGAKFWTGADVLALLTAERTPADVAAVDLLRRQIAEGRTARRPAARTASPHAAAALFCADGLKSPTSDEPVIEVVEAEPKAEGSRRSRKVA